MTPESDDFEQPGAAPANQRGRQRCLWTLPERPATGNTYDASVGLHPSLSANGHWRKNALLRFAATRASRREGLLAGILRQQRVDALVRGDSAVEFRVIGDPGKQAPHANSMDRRSGGNGSTPRMEPEREPVRGSAQRDSVLLSEGLAGDPAHAARRMVATGKCLRLCW